MYVNLCGMDLRLFMLKLKTGHLKQIKLFICFLFLCAFKIILV